MEIQLKEDEYLGEDGLPHCKHCKAPRMALIEDFYVHVICECQKQELENKQKEKRQQDLITKQINSGISKKHMNAFFKNAQITPENKEIYKKLNSYVKNARAMLDNNIGLFLTGPNSSGKTFAAACLCNELIYAGYTCCFTNLFNLVQDKFKYEQTNRTAETCNFVILDDLGKEFIGREYDPSQAKFAERVLVEWITQRYNADLPVIITSNFELDDLLQQLSLDKTITERINEMATRIIHFKETNFRDKNQKHNSEIAKKFGI